MASACIGTRGTCKVNSEEKLLSVKFKDQKFNQRVENAFALSQKCALH